MYVWTMLPICMCIIYKRERLHWMFSVSYSHSKRKHTAMYSGTYLYAEVSHSYFLATCAHITTEICLIYFYVTGDINNYRDRRILKRYTRCSTETILVSFWRIVRSFFPKTRGCPYAYVKWGEKNATFLQHDWNLGIHLGKKNATFQSGTIIYKSWRF